MHANSALCMQLWKAVAHAGLTYERIADTNKWRKVLNTTSFISEHYQSLAHCDLRAHDIESTLRNKPTRKNGGAAYEQGRTRAISPCITASDDDRKSVLNNVNKIVRNVYTSTPNCNSKKTRTKGPHIHTSEMGSSMNFDASLDGLFIGIRCVGLH